MRVSMRTPVVKEQVRMSREPVGGVRACVRGRCACGLAVAGRRWMCVGALDVCVPGLDVCARAMDAVCAWCARRNAPANITGRVDVRAADSESDPGSAAGTRKTELYVSEVTASLLRPEHRLCKSKRCTCCSDCRIILPQ